MPDGATRGGVTATTSGSGSHRARTAGAPRPGRAPCELGDEQQRAVEAVSEALGQEVEGVARAEVRRVVAGVAGVEAQREDGARSTTMTASETTASGHGRAWTISLHRRQRESGLGRLAARGAVRRAASPAPRRSRLRGAAAQAHQPGAEAREERRQHR